MGCDVFAQRFGNLQTLTLEWGSRSVVNKAGASQGVFVFDFVSLEESGKIYFTINQARPSGQTFSVRPLNQTDTLFVNCDDGSIR